MSTGILAARETQVPYDEALLLRVRSRVLRHQGDDAGALRDWADAERILESLGASTITAAGTDDEAAAHDLAAHRRVAEDVDEVAAWT